MHFLYILFAILLFNSCEEAESLLVAPASNSLGSMSGIIYDYNSGESLNNVTISWYEQGVLDSTTTDSLGYYYIPLNSTGEFLVTFSAEGYAVYQKAVILEALEPLLSGDVQNLNIIENVYLPALNAGLKGTIVPNTYNTGGGLMGFGNIEEDVMVTLKVESPSYNPYEQNNSFLPNSYTAKVDSDFNFIFENLPALENVDLSVFFSDEVYSYYGYANNIDLISNKTINHNINTYISGNDNILFITSNVEAYSSDGFNTTSNIILTFSKDIGVFDVTLKDSNNQRVFADVSKNGNTIIINPYNELEPYSEYSIIYTVHAGDYNNNINSSLNFITASDSDSSPDVVDNFEQNESSGWSADYNTSYFNFQWDTVEDADGYRIYAKDTNQNTDYIEVGTFYNQDNLQIQYGSINLYSFSQFSGFDYDNEFTPFINSTGIVFIITAYNELGESGSSSPVTVFDTTVPTISYSVNGIADNSSSSSSEAMTITINSNEYLSTNIFYSHYANYGSAYELSDDDLNIVYGNDYKSAELTINVPAYTNITGNNIVISNIKDSSGNTYLEQIVIEITEDLLYYVFHDFEDATLPSDWYTGGDNSWYGYPSFEATTDESYSGNYSIGINYTPYAEYLYTDYYYDIPYGAEVTVSFYLYQNNNYSSRFYHNNGNTTYLYNYGYDDWVYVEYTFINYYTYNYFYWRAYEPDTPFYIDDFKITYTEQVR